MNRRLVFRFAAEKQVRLEIYSTSGRLPQVLQVNFDPRIFGFILEFFQVMLMSIYSGRAASPTLPPAIGDTVAGFPESSSFGSSESDR
jgi:hypothetical protein